MATYSDNFNRASLGSNWTTAPGSAALALSGNRTSGGAAYWSANACAADQTVAASVLNLLIDGSQTCEVRARQSAAANTCYRLVAQLQYDLYEGSYWQFTVALYRVVAGSSILLASANPTGIAAIEVSASGTAITARYKTTAGGSWVTLGTYTDSQIANGQPGAGGVGLDDWSVVELAAAGVFGQMPAGAISIAGSLGALAAIPGAGPMPGKAVTLSGSLGWAPYAPPATRYSDNFDGLAVGAAPASPWRSFWGLPVGGSATLVGYISNSAPSSPRDAYYTAPISSNHYSALGKASGQTTPKRDERRRAHICRGSWQTADGYYGTITTNSYEIRRRKGGFATVLASSSVGWTPGFTYTNTWFEATSIGVGSPVRLRLWADGVLIAEVWDNDTASIVEGGAPGIYLDAGYAVDDWSAGELGPPPTPCAAPLPAGALALSGSVGEPVPGGGALPAGAVALSGNLGVPVPCVTALPAGSLSITGSLAGVVSRVKRTAVFPTFSAAGGLNTYANTQKGTIATGSERTIGYRVGIGNDGTAGDRVFLSVPAGDLIRADVVTNPVSKATLHLVFLSMQSWDYRATGAAAAVTGDAFKVRKVVSGSGMSAVLAGDYGTIAGRPVWLSGQHWYDGATRGQPVWDCEVDVTALYNEAAQAGVDLNLALECVFSDTKWLAEIVGLDPNMLWARPRIEVHRWGATALSIADADTCSPTISVTPPAGATLTAIRWGYDEATTPVGGVYKYRPDDGGGEVEGKSTSSPYTLPMLVSSSRVFVDVEVDFGVLGALMFRRTLKTPQTFAPKAELRADLYAPASGPTVGTDGWLDVRGPSLGTASASGDTWIALVKRYIPEWAPSTVYPAGARVAAHGSRWYTKTGGTSGTTAPANPSPSGNSDGGVTWFSQYDNASLGVTATPDQPGAGYGWDLYRMHNSPADPNPLTWRHVVGRGVGMDSAPFPTYAFEDPANFGAADPGGTDLHVIADDVSPPYYDPILRVVHFLVSTPAADGWEVRLWTLWPRDGNTLGWGRECWDAVFKVSQTAVLYPATAPPDLSHARVIRCADYRSALSEDPHSALLAAFVADGSLRIMAEPSWQGPTVSASDFGEPQGTWVPVPSLTGWTAEQTVAVSSSARLSAVHLLTRNGTHKTVIAAADAAGGWLGIRGDDAQTYLDGGGFTTERGAWATRSMPFVRAWATETMPFDASGDVPDAETVALAVQKPDGSVVFFNHQNLYAAGYPQTKPPALAPDADFSTANTWNREKRAVWKWPAVTGAQAFAQAHNGGAVNLTASGATLSLERVADFLRVSDSKSLVFPAAIEAVYAQADALWLEGTPTPIITKHVDGYRTALVTIGQDPERMTDWRTSPINAVRFSSGTAGPAVKLTANMRDPAAIVRLVGHNVFATSWTFDDTQPNPLGVMNEAGWLYFGIRCAPGDRLRILVPNSPLFGGIWQNGILRPTTLDETFQPEALGGFTWMQGRFATFFWTNDPPTTPARRWRRVLDGMDYVLDGESNGGCFVIDIRSPGDTLYLAFDLPSDVADWKADVASWLSSPNAALVKWANAKGELLYGVGPRADEPLSEVATETIDITW